VVLRKAVLRGVKPYGQCSSRAAGEEAVFILGPDHPLPQDQNTRGIVGNLIPRR